MTDLTGSPLGSAKIPPRANIYTVLVAVAAVALLAAVAFVLIRNIQLTGDPFPFGPIATTG